MSCFDFYLLIIIAFTLFKIYKNEVEKYIYIKHIRKQTSSNVY